jgi:hypothetical protein
MVITAAHINYIRSLGITLIILSIGNEKHITICIIA